MAGMLKATGERVIPDLQRDQLVYAEHLVRYRLAAQFAPGRRVLDVGSGEGYGTALIAAAGADSAVGIDLDEESVAHARARYGLTFQQGEATSLPFKDRSFDLLVCFEVIEHLDDDVAAVAEFRRVLAEDGLLMISTPNSAEYLVENQFHKREYSLDQFDALLAGHFEERLPLYQQNWLLSAVFDEPALSAVDESKRLELDVVKVAALEPSRTLYSVVICGPVGREPDASAVLTGVFEANRLSRELDSWIERSRTAEHLRDVYEKRGDAWQERATIAERTPRACWNASKSTS